MKKIVIMAGYDISEVILDTKDHDFTIIIPTNETLFPDNNKHNIVCKFQNKVIEVEYDENEILGVLNKLNPDVLITMGWRRIISYEIIKMAKLSINVHPAILPEYKGYHTEPYVIMNNEKEHGITAHILTEKLDEGEIILQKKVRINRFSTVNSLKHLVGKEMPLFFRELVEQIENDSIKLTAVDQISNKVVAKKRCPKDSEVNSHLPLIELYDCIRACDSEKYPAFFYVDGEKINIKIWRDTTKKETVYDI